MEVAAYDRDVGEYWYGPMRPFSELVRERLECDRVDGHVDPAMDPAATALVLTAMVERFYRTALCGRLTVDDEQLARSLGRAIWSVLGAP